MNPDWWRDAVVYQIYPRSFADADGDGIGDIDGIRSRLGYLADLGVDAIWISPWYRSPLLDGGYDISDYRDIHPQFGTLDDADALVAEAHQHGLRVLIDLVPNHCSWEHPWFRRALAAPKGSAERELFWFRDGKTGPEGKPQPPSNWRAAFGGSAWEPTADGQWYLHLFDVSQPDWNWSHPAVAEEFDSILRFWFDRGVDGFRVDVADSMVKDPALPDTTSLRKPGEHEHKYVGHPFYDQAGVHDIHRRWRRVADSYADSDLGPRIFVAEVWLSPADRMTAYLQRDQLQSAFNFDFLECRWTPEDLREVIDVTIAAHAAVEAPATWVLSNHDTLRHRTRYGRPQERALVRIGTIDADLELGLRRARAAALLEFALPGGAYVYQGDELGLPEVEDIADDELDDPTWERSGHVVRGRDGCRVPIPWSGSAPPYGFGPGEGQPWLPQPAGWADLTVAAQSGHPESHLELYRSALRIRREHPALGVGKLIWDQTWNAAPVPPGVLSFTREPGFRCVLNLSDRPVRLPQLPQQHQQHEAAAGAGADAERRGPRLSVLLASDPLIDDQLPVDAAVWLST